MSEPITTSDSLCTSTSMAPLPKRPFARLRLALLVIAALVGMVALSLLSGLVLFTGYVLLASENTLQKADAIVVVTGGAGRLDNATKLFQKGYGKRLLISGVHRNYSANNLEAGLKLTPAQISCCIDLDRKALNTVANATQTAIWAKKHKFSRLILVTSAYHMPRTLLEMERAAPNVEFQAYAVRPSNSRGLFQRLFDGDNVHLLTKEYGKLLLSIVYGTRERLASYAKPNKD